MKVRVKNWGNIYSTYDRWFKDNNCEEYLEQYKQEERLFETRCYGMNWYAVDENNNIINTDNITYEVIKKAPHDITRNSYTMCYLIEEPITKKVYLIGESGVEEVKEND